MPGPISLKSLILLLSLCVFHKSILGDVYKCKKSGKVAYQSQPCTPSVGQGSKLEVENKKQSTGAKMSVVFSDMRAMDMLYLIADFSGNKLIYDSSIASIKKPNAYHYNNIAWDTLLNIVAQKHNLDIKVENKTIYAHQYGNTKPVRKVYPPPK